MPRRCVPTFFSINHAFPQSRNSPSPAPLLPRSPRQRRRASAKGRNSARHLPFSKNNNSHPCYLVAQGTMFTRPQSLFPRPTLVLRLCTIVILLFLPFPRRRHLRGSKLTQNNHAFPQFYPRIPRLRSLRAACVICVKKPLGVLRVFARDNASACIPFAPFAPFALK
jgi:hypothetical protein